jgi:hypothetical protein
MGRMLSASIWAKVETTVGWRHVIRHRIWWQKREFGWEARWFSVSLNRTSNNRKQLSKGVAPPFPGLLGKCYSFHGTISDCSEHFQALPFSLTHWPPFRMSGHWVHPNVSSQLLSQLPSIYSKWHWLSFILFTGFAFKTHIFKQHILKEK